MIRSRPLGLREKPLLPRFLALAAHESDVEKVLLNPALSIYVEEWGRTGDCAVVAENEESGGVVGIAWARFWSAEKHGFGWIDEWTPELAVAIEDDFREQGVGTMLVGRLMERLSEISLFDTNGDNFRPRRVALNVRSDSNAVSFYERLGFVRIEGSERRNRIGGISFNMVAPL